MNRNPDEIVQLKLRFREELRLRTEEAANRNGNSLNAEIVQRLNKSFDLEAELGGSQGLALFRALAFSLKVIEQQVGDWRTDSVAFFCVRKTFDKMLEVFEPPYHPTIMSPVHDQISRRDRGKEQLVRLAELIENQTGRRPRDLHDADQGSVIASDTHDWEPLLDGLPTADEIDTLIEKSSWPAPIRRLLKDYHCARLEVEAAKSAIQVHLEDLVRREEEALKAVDTELDTLRNERGTR